MDEFMKTAVVRTRMPGGVGGQRAEKALFLPDPMCKCEELATRHAALGKDAKLNLSSRRVDPKNKI